MAGFIKWKEAHETHFLAFFRVCFVLYLLLLVRLIVFKYPIPILRGIMDEWDVDMVKRGVYTANLIPFKSIRMYIRYYERIDGFDNLFGNILAFIPFGFLLPVSFQKLKHIGFILLHSFWFSLGIELFQLVSHFGEFDVDDLILNCLGAILGYLAYRCFMAAINSKKVT